MRLTTILLAAMAVATTAAAKAPATASPPAAPPADVALARDILKELVELNTTHSHGTLVAADAIAKRLLAAGYDPTDVKVLAPAEHPNSGSVVVRLHGKNPKLRPVLFNGHLDVVEARAEDWSTDPFKLVLKDGYFYGRGTIDMKDGDAAMVETLIRLKREGWRPDRDVIFALTADEEAGGDANGPAWLLKMHRDLIDAAYVINLDGGDPVLKNGKPFSFGFDSAEKVYLTFKLETTSPGGHGSLPGPDNAIYRLGDGLQRLEHYRFPVATNPTTRAWFAAAATQQTGQTRDDMLAVAKDRPDLAAADRLSDESVFLNAELRTTCVATLISGGHAENALPQRATATVQCRMMPGDTAENVGRQITTVLNDPKIKVSVDVAPIEAPDSPLTPEVVTKIEAVAHQFAPGVPVIPTMATGFSDGRQFRNAGMPTYALNGVWFEQGENRAHGRDERIIAASFDQSVEFTYRLVKAFGSGK
jgi:acetylornithine deacetylase/succinyl-diaminopimelate desuccinylase-like protein